MWNYTKTALKRAFDLRGRSSRAEFWSFTGFCITVLLVFATLSLLPLIQLSHDAKVNLDAPAWRPFGLLLLFGLFTLLLAVSCIILLVPWYTVLLRRMHDLGKKGLTIIYSTVSNILSVVGLALLVKLLSLSDHHLAGLAMFGFYILLIPVGIVVLTALVFDLIVFINTLRAGEPNNNKYGPPAA